MGGSGYSIWQQWIANIDFSHHSSTQNSRVSEHLLAPTRVKNTWKMQRDVPLIEWPHAVSRPPRTASPTMRRPTIPGSGSLSVQKITRCKSNPSYIATQLYSNAFKENKRVFDC